MARPGLRRGHDAGGNVVVEREHRDCRFPDREGRGRDDGRQQPLEALTRLGQLCRDPRASGMRFGSDMVGDEPYDPLPVDDRNSPAGIFEPAAQPIDP